MKKHTIQQRCSLFACERSHLLLPDPASRVLDQSVYTHLHHHSVDPIPAYASKQAKQERTCSQLVEINLSDQKKKRYIDKKALNFSLYTKSNKLNKKKFHNLSYILYQVKNIPLTKSAPVTS